MLVVCTTRTWCVDIRTTDHVCNLLQGFQETQHLTDQEIYLWMGDTTKVALIAVGEITLHFGGNRVIQFLPYNRLTQMSLT